jgi:hypothetical protein
MMEEHTLRAFVYTMLRRIFGPSEASENCIMKAS